MASFPISIELARKFAPIVTFHQFEKFLPCSIDWLLSRSTLKDRNAPSFTVPAPKQSDLEAHYQPNYYLLIGNDDATRHGEPLVNGKVTAPMYVTTQEWDDCIEFTYSMLYAFQGGQTCRGLRLGAHFNCIVNNFGWHQGDLEWISVLTSKDFTKILYVGYAAHGDFSWYGPGQYETAEGRPKVRVALNGHPCRNGLGKNDNDWIFTFELPGILGTVDIITATGLAWRAFESPGGLVMIGLDEQNNPIGDQRWVKFQGRMGDSWTNTLTGATDVDGHTGLSGPQWADVSSDAALGKLFDALPGEAIHGDGPWGPGGRDFTQHQRQPGLRIWSFNNGYTGFTASAPPSVAVFGNQFHCLFRDGSGNGLMHITSLDGILWSPSHVFHPDYTTSAGPCSVVWGGHLHVFFRDGNGNGILHVMSADGTNFQPAPNWYIGLNCDGQPSAALLGNKLCLVALDHGGNGIMRSVATDVGHFDNGYTGFNTNPSSPPAIVSYRGKFHVFFMDHGGNGLMHIVSADGLHWQTAGVFHPDFTTSAGPCPVVFQNQLHVFFRDGTGNGILHIASTDGDNFGATMSWYLGQNCDGQPAAAVLNNILCVAAIDAGGRGIMRSVVKAAPTQMAAHG
jgi:hypothetical protein